MFQTAYAKIGIYICYDRHFPECARILALKGAEILFNPSATTEGKSKYLWELEQPAQAVANGVFIGANNRVGLEKPWEFGKFYGSSYFCDPRGKLLVKGSDDKDEVVVADLDLDVIREVRDGWQFFRDRRPELYGEITQQLPCRMTRSPRPWIGQGSQATGRPVGRDAAKSSSSLISKPGQTVDFTVAAPTCSPGFGYLPSSPRRYTWT